MVNQSNSIKKSESNTKQKGMRLFRSKIDKVITLVQTLNQKNRKTEKESNSMTEYLEQIMPHWYNMINDLKRSGDRKYILTTKSKFISIINR